MNSLSLKIQLLIAFLVIASISLAVGVVGYVHSNAIFETFNSIADETVPELVELGEIQATINNIESNVQSQILYRLSSNDFENSKFHQHKMQEFEKLKIRLNESIENLVENHDEIPEWHERSYEFETNNAKIIQRHQIEFIKNAEYFVNIENGDLFEIKDNIVELEQISNKFEEQVQQRIRFELSELELKDNLGENIASESIINITLVIILGIGISIFVSILFTTSIVSPFNKLQKQVPEIAKGNFDIKLVLEGPTEIRGLINGFNNMANELKKLDQTKQNLSSIVSHELRTPLVPIMGNLDILLLNKSENLSYDQKLRIEKIKDKCNFMKDLITDIIDLNKIQGGILTIHKKQTSLNSIIHYVLDNFDYVLAKKHIKVEINCSDFQIEADKNRLIQVFSNLIANSIDFCPKENPKISITAYDEKDNIRIIIKDNGKGLNQKELTKIFDSFYQVDDTHTRDHGGTGIGLAVCRGIIKKHGGEIWAESKGVGSGTQIIITMPASKNF